MFVCIFCSKIFFQVFNILGFSFSPYKIEIFSVQKKTLEKYYSTQKYSSRRIAFLFPCVVLKPYKLCFKKNKNKYF